MVNEVQDKKFIINKVVYYDSQKQWGVLGLTCKDDLGELGTSLLNAFGSISASGNFMKPYENAEIILSGDVIENPKYGKQISVKKLDILHDTTSKEGIINYLSKGEIEGIGVKLAEKIYDFFGEDAIEIVTEQTDRLKEVDGIGKKTVEKVKGSVAFLKAHKPIVNFLTKMGISYGTIIKLIQEFGDSTIEVISKNPYEILEVSKDLSFSQVDEIFLKSGGAFDDPLRLKTAFLHLLKRQAMMEGSTGCTSSSLSKKFYSLLDLAGAEDYYVRTATSLEGENKIVVGIGALSGWMSGYIYYKEYLDIERKIAEKIKALQSCNVPNKKVHSDIVEEEIKNFPFELNKQQVKAIHACLENNVAVLTGSAGCITGDTLISMSRASLGRKRPIELMYKSYNNIPYKGSHGWRKDVTTYVRSYIEGQGLIRLNEVEDIVYSGKKEVWKLTLEDGKFLKATADHKIMTKKGFKPLGELCPCDYVMVDNLVRHKAKINKGNGRRKLKDKLVTVGKFHPYAVNHGRNSYRIEIHRAIVEADLNKMSLDEFCKACKSPNNMGFINPSEFHVHHKDRNHYNNDIENLEVLPMEEHKKFHAKDAYKNFGHGVPEYSRVKSIEYLGVEDTYDICCYDHHNFVANGIVVHNSGKSSITKALYRIYNRCGFNVVLLSATAKACRRLEECTGGTAQTIHKFLGMTKDGYCE